MIHNGDCLEVMKQYNDNHFTNILTDPPYGLSFMNKAWDHSVPGKEFWVEALRICKPGAIMLCFGGTRTYHRLTCAIEDAGWEIRDCLMWLYGSGFPKSHNHFGFEGYGTALKPAYEPIIMAMKPCDGTFAQNAEKWGVAGINIESSRIDGKRWPANILFDEEAADMLDKQSGISKSPAGNIRGTKSSGGILSRIEGNRLSNSGHNDSGGASRFFYCAKASSAERNKGCEDLPLVEKPLMGEFKENPGRETPKSSPTARQNFHPTVKPLKLLEYLLKLIAPPKTALVLDPFAGSGSTCVAAQNLGIACEGIEISPEYCEIAIKRCERELTLF